MRTLVTISPTVTEADRKLARDLQRVVQTIGGPVLACDPADAAELIAAHVARAILAAKAKASADLLRRAA